MTRCPEEARRLGILDRQGVRELRRLYGMRIKADYTEDSVEFEQANVAVDMAGRSVKGLLR